jgi:hypothetical protein
MEARHDLRKFITELTVAERCGVLSSGRDVDRGVGSVRASVQHRKNVGRLTPWAGIESSTANSSDQTAAEALQEAETEVGVRVMVDRGAYVGRAGWRPGVPIG